MGKNTVHKISTEHGYDTPHQMPFDIVEDLKVLNNLSAQLYPTGRAWYGTEDGTLKNLHESLNTSILRFVKAGKLLIDSSFPDNKNFDLNDAELWEFRLGLITNKNVDLETRKNAIKRKLSYPNNVKSRQHRLFIENQLQLSGFNVWVHENTKPYKSPDDFIGNMPGDVFHADTTYHGNSTFHGGDSYSIIANNINEIESYAIGDKDHLWATFFIGGETLGETAIVPSKRLREFKELVIKLKPAHTVAFTFINYI